MVAKPGDHRHLLTPHKERRIVNLCGVKVVAEGDAQFCSAEQIRRPFGNEQGLRSLKEG